MSNDPHMVQDFGQQELVRVVRNMENSVQNMIGQRIGQRLLSDAMPVEIFWTPRWPGSSLHLLLQPLLASGSWSGWHPDELLTVLG